MDLQRWAGKVAVVTGASSGIGWAVAKALGMAGLRLSLTARRADRLEALAAEITAMRSETEVFVHRADARDTKALEGFFAATRAHYGGVDVLVNNAGLGRDAPLMSGETERWREMLDVNVLALCVATREAVADMRQSSDRGHVIHISSMAGHRTPLRSGVYSATKFAVRALTEGLRAELRAAGSAIRVTAISPGFVETEFARVYNDGDEDKARDTYGSYPCLQPSDIADAVLYALGTPDHVAVHDLLLRPTQQPD